LRLALVPQAGDRPGEPALVIADAAARLPGRGAYICGPGACLEGALRKRALQRAFRRPVKIDSETLESLD
jgi:predicted RNA-binding protein YlxR (DUF448 family)